MTDGSTEGRIGPTSWEVDRTVRSSARHPGPARERPIRWLGRPTIPQIKSRTNRPAPWMVGHVLVSVFHDPCRPQDGSGSESTRRAGVCRDRDACLWGPEVLRFRVTLPRASRRMQFGLVSTIYGHASMTNGMCREGLTWTERSRGASHQERDVPRPGSFTDSAGRDRLARSRAIGAASLGRAGATS